MTERNYGENFSWFSGIVVDINDPDQSGRVRIRVDGQHDDVTNIPDSALPWTLPQQDITNAAYGKLGKSPLGMVKGTRIFGYWMDIDHQIPIISNVYGKAGDEMSNQSNNGTQVIDPTKGSMPTPSQKFANTPAQIKTPYYANNSIKSINDGTANVFSLSTSVGTDPRQAVQSFMKQANSPTIASLNKNISTDLLSMIKQVDPNNVSSTFKNSISSLISIKQIIDMASPVGQNNILSSVLSSVMTSIPAVIGSVQTITLFTGLINSGLVAGNVLTTLQTVLSSVQILANNNNSSIPFASAVSTIIPVIDPNFPIPSPIVTTVPANYTQIFYSPITAEPYPGYIAWEDFDTGDIIYTLRGNIPYYPSLQDQTIGNIAAQLLADIISGQNISSAANALVNAVNSITNGAFSCLGNGLNLQNIISIASKLIPTLSNGIEKSIENALPKSVLNVTSVQTTLQNHTKNQALLHKKAKLIKQTGTLDKNTVSTGSTYIPPNYG